MKINPKIPFGGVKFNTEVKGKVKSKNGEILYFVKLPDNTKVVYPKQHGAEIKMFGGGSEKIQFNGLKDAEITDTKKSDFYRLTSCENTKLNAATKKDDKDIIVFDETNKNSKVNLNKGDSIYAYPNIKTSEENSLKHGFRGLEAVQDCTVECK